MAKKKDLDALHAPLKAAVKPDLLAKADAAGFDWGGLAASLIPIAEALIQAWLAGRQAGLAAAVAKPGA